MKRFISKAKNLSQRAAELKAAMQQLPPKVAEVRETIAATAGQLQQLKVDVQSSVTDLKADNEHHISRALQEINTSLDVFLEAGFELGGVDLEISPVQRLLVHLHKLEDVHPSVIRSLLAANQPRKTTRAVLTALLQAQEMAETVELANLDYVELVVGVGPIPSVRICWRAEEMEEVPTAPPSDQTISVPPPIATPAPPSVFSQSSFFEKRQSQPLPLPASIPPSPQLTAHAAPKVQATAVVESQAQEAHVQQPAPEPSLDPLARFKKMPELTQAKK